MTAAGAAPTATAFNPKVMLAVIVAGALALAAYLVLTAYSPQLAKGNNGGAHALSNSATGFAGLVALTKQAGVESIVSRDQESPTDGSLLVLTPEASTAPGDVEKIVNAHQAIGPTLIILPKWETSRHPYRPGWVQIDGTIFMNSLDMLPLKGWETEMKLGEMQSASGRDWTFQADFEEGERPIRFRLPATYQGLSCARCESPIALPDGKLLVATLWWDYPVYILADPDILNNHGLRTKEQARAALTLLDRLAEYGDADHVVFDVTLNGFGKQRSILRFLFEPPFLAITLCLVLAAILAGWQAFNRFGPPARRAREIALGKTALIVNGAELMRQAGKDHHGAVAYARNVRDHLAQALKAPGGLEDTALDQWLDRFTPPGMPKFSELMYKMTGTSDAGQMVEIGRDMSRWRKGVLREH